jgi:hypothetical protein
MPHIQVDPRTLHLPGGRYSGADPAKLQRQISRYGRSNVGMPPIQLYLGSDGRYVIADGMTRATRIARLSPGTMIEAEIIRVLKRRCGTGPTVQERLP